MSEEVRAWLRALPPFPAVLPEVGELAESPAGFFLRWLSEAVATGIPAPHAMTLSTAGAGAVSARVLILKDVDDDGFTFAKSASSPTGRALAADPRAALTFFWPALGRQVRVEGTARRQDDAVARADFLARPASSRVSTLVGRQSEVLLDRADYAAARDEVDAAADRVADDWAVWVVEPASVEFWQAAADRAHRRIRYRATAAGWLREELWP